jgi:hypothetical protein
MNIAADQVSNIKQAVPTSVKDIILFIREFPDCLKALLMLLLIVLHLSHPKFHQSQR